MEHLPCICVYVCLCVFAPMCASVCDTCVCAWILELGESVHVHYIRQSVWGVPQRVCTAVCSELSAPAGSAIPIYPSATAVGGKGAGHRCWRFHMWGTRLPVKGPLCRGDEGGRLQGTVWGSRFCWGKGGRAAQHHAGIRRLSVLWGAWLPSCTSVWHQALWYGSQGLSVLIHIYSPL